MAAAIFYPFNRLPKELRDQIWEEAIRPDVPSAHFFSAWDSRQHASYPRMAELSVAGRGEDRDIPCGLAAPRRNKAEPDIPSWFDNNPSVYLEDGGLWTACKESREATTKRFGNHRVVYQRPPVDEDEPAVIEPFEHIVDAPTIGTMVQDGRRQHFTVCPKTDLFCIQPFGGTRSGISWDRFEGDVPIFNKQGIPRPHIALEFDPLGWMMTRINTAIQNGFCRTQEEVRLARYRIKEAATDRLGEWASRLWFIDYRIRCGPQAGPLDTEGLTTFRGRGCTFIDITDELNCTRPGKYNFIDPDAPVGWIWGDDRPQASMHFFLDALNEELDQYANHYQLPYPDVETETWITWPPRDNAPVIAVLACVPDSAFRQRPDPDYGEQ